MTSDLRPGTVDMFLARVRKASEHAMDAEVGFRHSARAGAARVEGP